MSVGLLSFAQSVFAALAKSNMQVNLGGTSYFDSTRPFLNWALTSDARGFNSGTVTLQQAAYNGWLDAITGELVSGSTIAGVTNVSVGLFTVPPGNYEESVGTTPPWWLGQVWNVTWEGTSSGVNITGSLGTGGTSSFGSNSGTITFGSTDPSNVSIILPVTDVNDPPRKITAYLSQYATNVANGEYWDPRFISNLSNFGIFRTVNYSHGVNGGAMDISQLANFGYVRMAQGGSGIAAFHGKIDNGSGSAGNTLTTTSSVGLQIGQIVNGPAGMTECTVTAVLTSTTYTVDGSPQLVAANSSMGARASLTYMSSAGPRQDIHPDVLCDLAIKTQCHIWYCIPPGMSDTGMAQIAAAFQSGLAGTKLQVLYEYANEIWNTTNAGFWMGTHNAPFAQTSIGLNWGGYRSAQLMRIIHDTYGPSNRKRWQGVLAGQFVDTTSVAAEMTGVTYYLSNEAPGGMVLTDLYDAGAGAPYWGQQGDSFGLKTIASFTPNGATTTVSSTAHGLTTGNVRRFACSGGTGASSVDYLNFSVTFIDANTFSIPVSTTGLTFSGTMFHCSPAIFDIIDASVAAGPGGTGVNPTIYSYWVQQMSKCAITGTADAGPNATYTWSSSVNLAGLVSGAKANQLYLNGRKLAFYQYEGGFNLAPSSALNPSTCYNKVVQFINNYSYDSPAIDTSYNQKTAAQAQFSLSDNVWSPIVSKYVLTLDGGTFNQWCGLRFYGDEGSPMYQALLTEASKPPFVDPTPAATWSLSDFNGSSAFFSSGSSTTASFSYTTGGGLVVIAASWTNSAVLTGVTINGTAMNIDASNASSWSQAICSLGGVAAGTYTVQLTWASAAPFRTVYAMTLANTTNSLVQSSTGLGTVVQKSQNLAVQKGAFVIAVASLTAAATFNSQSSQPGFGTWNTVDLQTAQASGIGYISPGPSFNSSIFNVQTFGSNGICAASYK